MKALVLSILAASILMGFVEAVPPGGSRKGFESGASGLGYLWNAGWEGDNLIFVVFAYGQRQRELGEEYAEWVKVSGAETKHPKAVLYRSARETTDLLTAPDQIYQIDRAGHISTLNERATAKEYREFMNSKPQEYTAEALLAFVHEQRARQ